MASIPLHVYFQMKTFNLTPSLHHQCTCCLHPAGPKQDAHFTLLLLNPQLFFAPCSSICCSVYFLSQAPLLWQCPLHSAHNFSFKLKNPTNGWFQTNVFFPLSVFLHVRGSQTFLEDCLYWVSLTKKKGIWRRSPWLRAGSSSVLYCVWPPHSLPLPPILLLNHTFSHFTVILFRISGIWCSSLQFNHIKVLSYCFHIGFLCKVLKL